MEWMEPIRQLFSHVCGEVNLWSVGGETLPFCQRCTGLYVGGLYAALLMIVFRPALSVLTVRKANGRPPMGGANIKLLAIHLLLLLQMAPFGLHLVPHGPAVRTITGQLFALGLVYCLSVGFLDIGKKVDGADSARSSDVPNLARRIAVGRGSLAGYALAAFIGMPLLLLAIRFGGPATALVLALCGLGGLGVYSALAVGNLVRFAPVIPPFSFVIPSEARNPLLSGAGKNRFFSRSVGPERQKKA